MMRRLCFTVLGLAVLTAATVLSAAPPQQKGKDDKNQNLKDIKDLQEKEKALQERYAKFEAALQDLHERWSKGTDADKKNAERLKLALDKSTGSTLTERFASYVRFLATVKTNKVTEINKLVKQSDEIGRDLREVLRLLKDGQKTVDHKAEKLTLEKQIEQLDKLIKQEKIIIGQIEIGLDPKNIKENQNDVTQATKELSKQLAKNEADKKPGGEKDPNQGKPDDKSEPKGSKSGGEAGKSKDAGKEQKSGENKPGDAKNQGDKKPGDKTGEAKQGGKEGKESKPGDSKDGKGSESKAGDSKPGKGSESKSGDKKESAGDGKGKEGDAKNEGDKKPGEDNKSSVKTKEDEKKAGDGEKKEGSAKSGQQGDKQGSPKQGGDDKKSPSESKSGSQSDSKSSQGQSKSGKSSDSQGSPKSGGQAPDDQASNKKDKQDDDQQPTAKNSPKQNIDEAIQKQKQAEKDLGNNDPKAKDNIVDAKNKLEEAKKKLEELLRQLREEEQAALLATLIQRCKEMLKMQEAVLKGTRDVAGAIDNTKDKRPTNLHTQDSLNLSDDEKKIAVEATKAIELLEAEGSGQAFAEILNQIREDMKHVSRRLAATPVDPGKVTQAIEQDICDSLNEMIKALEKKQEDLKKPPPPPPPGGGQPPPPPDPKLLNKIQELKMVRAMQLRINQRTTLYGKAYPGEQADDAAIVRELADLATRQDRIFEITRNIAKGD